MTASVCLNSSGGFRKGVQGSNRFYFCDFLSDVMEVAGGVDNIHILLHVILYCSHRTTFMEPVPSRH